MEFSQWVDRMGGAKAVALKLEVTVHAVYRWIKGERIPKPHMLFKINKLSHGRITLSSMIQTHQRFHASKNSD